MPIKNVAQPPLVDQCMRSNGDPKSVLCQHERTNAKIRYPIEHSYLAGARVYTAKDYKAYMRYVDYLIREAQARCQ